METGRDVCFSICMLVEKYVHKDVARNFDLSLFVAALLGMGLVPKLRGRSLIFIFNILRERKGGQCEGSLWLLKVLI